MSDLVQVTGTVFKVYTKPFRGKDTFTIKLDRDPTWYRAGEKRFAGIAEPGNTITFMAKPRPEREDAFIEGDVKLAQQAPPAAPGVPTINVAESRNTSIVYQSSRKDAMEFLKLLVQAEALKLPTKVAEKVGALEAALDRYTAQFYDDVGTLGALTREAAQVEQESAAAKAADDSDE